MFQLSRGGGMVDAKVSKTFEPKAHVGSTPSLGTLKYMTKIIGLVGEKGSGKQTFVNFLKGILPNKNIRQVRFSDILAQTLMIWDIPLTRPNLQKLALVMNDAFGAKALAKAAKFSAEGDPHDLVIFDGIRREAEFKLVKSFKGSIILYITALGKLRFKRLKIRSEKVGETALTFEQFLAEEQSKAETAIPGLGKKADKKIENNAGLDEFKAKIQKFSEVVY